MQKKKKKKKKKKKRTLRYSFPADIIQDREPCSLFLGLP